VSEGLRDDRELALLAINFACHPRSKILPCLSARLRHDPEILQAVQRRYSIEEAVRPRTDFPELQAALKVFHQVPGKSHKYPYTTTESACYWDLVKEARCARIKKEIDTLYDELLSTPEPGKKKARYRNYHDLATSWRRVKDTFPEDCPIRLSFARPGARSDVLISCEIFEGKQGYKPWCKPEMQKLFELLPGDKVLDLGANAGFFVLFAHQEMKGRGTIIAYEPSVFTAAVLNINTSCLESGDFGDFHVKTIAKMVTKEGGEEILDDHTFSSRGAARSGTGKKDIYGNKKYPGLVTYPVQADAFHAIVEADVTVIKMDIERCELSLLTDERVDYKNVRCLYVEISRKWLVTKNPDGSGWKRFSAILKLLERQEFSHIDIPSCVYKSKYWKQRDMDFTMFAYRKSADSEEHRNEVLGGLSHAQVEHLNRWRRFDEELRADKASNKVLGAKMRREKSHSDIMKKQDKKAKKKRRDKRDKKHCEIGDDAPHSKSKSNKKAKKKRLAQDVSNDDSLVSKMAASQESRAPR